MEPVKFELIAEDKTKPGTDSAGQNVDTLTVKINEQKALMQSLQAEISRLQKEAGKGTGMRSVEDIAQIELLEKKIKELQVSLIELQKQKETTSNVPLVTPQSNESLQATQKNIQNLRFNVQQVARELPSFAMGPEMFFLAISNNIPMLMDSVKRARAEFKLLSDEQKKNAMPVWKQLASSIFSWQTAMVIGITALVVYGKDLVNWTANLFKSKEAIDANAKAMRDLGDARLKGAQNAQSELTRLKLLYKGLTDENVARKDRLRIAKELQDKYPSYFGNLTAEQMLAGKATGAYMKLSTAILQAAKARAIADKITDNEKKNLELEGQYAMELGKLQRTPATELRSYGGRQWNAESRDYKLQKQRVDDIVKQRELLKSANEKLAKKIENPADLVDDIHNKPKKEKVKDIENLSDRIADAEVKAQQRIDELTLAAMRDGYEKQKAEAKRQLQQQLDQIDQEERERRQALDKARKQGINVTTSQYASVGTMAKAERNNAQQVYDNKLVSLYEAEMDNLTEKYEDYTNQRIAIEKEYTKEVERMAALRVEAQKKGDTQGVEMLDRSLAEATAKRGKDLMKLSFEQFQKSPEYIRAFEDLRTVSTETLQDLMKQMEAYKGVAAETWNPQDLREYTTTLQEIIDELMNRNPYEMLIQKRKELAKAEQDMKTAQMALDTVRSGGTVISGMTMVKGKGWVPTLLSEDAALKNLNKKKDDYNKLSKETWELTEKSISQTHELYLVLASIGDTIGGTQGKIISLLGSFGQFTSNLVSGILSVARTGVNALSAMEKASVILTLISTGIQLLQKLDELTSDSYDKYLKYDEKIEEINKLKDAVLDYEIAVLKAQQAEKGWFGEDSLQSLKDYKAQQEQIMNQYVAKAKEQQAIYQNQKGGGWFTNSLNYGILGISDSVFGTNFLGNNYKEGTTEALNNLRIETRKKSHGFLGSGVGAKSQKTEDLVSWVKKNLGEDLFSTDTVTGKDGEAPLVNLQVAQSVLDKFGDKLVGQTKETLEELVELRKQYDEFVAQLREYVSQLYSPLVDNMIDGLWDWLDEGKDALDSFKGYAKDTFRDIVSDMLKTIVMKKVFGTFEDDIAKIYEKYSGNDTDMASFAAEISETVKKLTDRYAEELPYLQELLKQISTSFSQSGIDLKDSSSASQSANTSVVSQVTEETMTWLAGGMVAQTNRLISVDNNITEFRNQLAAALSPLTEIAANTREMAERLAGIAADVLILRRDGTYIKN